MTTDPFIQLGIALGLGLLVGMQREWAAKDLAGVRTFALITLLGAVSAQLGQALNPWIVVAAFIGVVAALVMGNITLIRKGKGGGGVTTEIAALVMFAVGAALPAGFTAEALVVGGSVAVLLQWKRPLHEIIIKIGEDDFRAIIQFVLISLVVLPVLPNRTYGPFDVLNPFKIWLLVVLIVGISLGAYVAYKLLGTRGGTLLGGVLGGLISSTATTVSYARQSRQQPTSAAVASAVLMFASAIVYGRVLFEVGVVAPSILPMVGPPLAAMMAWMAAIAVVNFLFTQTHAPQPFEHRNPAQLKVAITFGALYAVVLFAIAAAKRHLGIGGLYAVAALSGLTDMDAITLSTAELVHRNRLEAATGWRLILIGSMSNLVFKTGVVAVLGHRGLLGRVAALFAIGLAGGVAILLLWPG
jgi:uncharacterized membrane protein (DUF4010 family)